MLNRQLFFSLFLSAFLIVGCSSQNTKPDEQVTDEESLGDLESTNENNNDAQGVVDEEVVILDPIDDPASDLSVRTVYFDYNSEDVREDSLLLVRTHGKYLSNHPDRLVRLEGHADERGTREYNLALGEARAKNVREILLLEGTQEEQIELVSFGEERPAAQGTDEESMRLNRRVEIIY